ncbi:hypothetical protein PR048_011984, partial [Dryococelus australis]
MTARSTEHNWAPILLLFGNDKQESLHTENISADETFWRQEITPKRERFYMHCTFPEIVDLIFP